MRKTKIIATIGPSSLNEDVLNKFNELDVNCIRLNTAHGDFDQYRKVIKLVRKYMSCPILLDIKGPEIRVKLNEELVISKGDKLWFSFNKSDSMHFSYDFYDEITKGQKIFFDNGLLEAKIEDKKNKKILVKFLESHLLRQNKGVNLPDVTLKIPNLSKKDKECIDFAIENNIEFIGLSFARNRQDIDNLKKYLKESNIGIISKIENWEGVQNIDEIIEHSFGIMIARGDLGIEIPEEKIPLIQKQIIKKTNQKAKISIVATQMLESMISNKTPTRAEISDVANAVLDGADAVMLSGETAIGKYPVQTIKIMNKVARELEKKVTHTIDMNKIGNTSEEMSKSAYELLFRVKANKLVTITRTGYSARLISRFRYFSDVVTVTNDQLTQRKLQIVWGVKPFYIKKFPKHALVANVAVELLDKKIINQTDKIVFFAGVKTMQDRISNLIELHKIKDLLEFHIKVKNGDD